MKTLNREYNISLKTTDFAFCGVLLCLFAVLTELFYRQSIRFHDAYNSDTFVYANGLGDIQKTRMIAWIFSVLKNINGATYEAALFMSLIVVLTVIANYLLVSHLLSMEKIHVERWKIQGISLIALLSGPIVIPVLSENFYYRAWAKYAWQSPTQQAMILFGIFTVLMLIKVYENYMEKIAFRHWLGLAVAVFLSAWAKPNFMLVISPALIIILISDLFRIKEYGLVHKLKRAVMLGCAMIPGGLFVLFINSREFDGEEENGIAVIPGFFLEFVKYPPIMIAAGIALPLIVLAFNFRELKKFHYKLSWGMCIIGGAEYLLLVETGENMAHGNFGWCKEAGNYYVFLVSLAILMKNHGDKEFMKDRPALRRAYLICAWIIIAAHVICGLVYLQYVIRGHLYRM